MSISQVSKRGLSVPFAPVLLLGFFMRLMLAAERAELFQLNPLRRRALVLRLAVVPVFAFAALELNNFTWHEFACFPL
jgi:hypothetical protein